MSTDTRTYLVESTKGSFKVEVPADWKVTFGPTTPGGKYGGGERSLRIYESEVKQRACFTDVLSFRDLSLPVTRLVVSESGESSWVNDGEGNVTEQKKRTRKVREVAG